MQHESNKFDKKSMSTSTFNRSITEVLNPKLRILSLFPLALFLGLGMGLRGLEGLLAFSLLLPLDISEEIDMSLS